MSSTSVTSSQEALAKGRSIRALAALFRQPSLWQGHEPSELEASLDQLGNAWARAGGQLIEEWRRALVRREECEIEFAQLFLGPFDIRVPPYASFYLEVDGQLMGEAASFVLESYSRAGIELADDVREMPDHVAIELDFVQYLMQDRPELSDQELFALRKEFWARHFSVWFPRFVDQIKRESEHPLYSCLSGFLLFSLTEPLGEAGAVLWN